MGALPFEVKSVMLTFDSGATTVSSSPTSALIFRDSTRPRMMGGSSPGAGRAFSASTEPATMCLWRSSTLVRRAGSTPLMATPDTSPLPRVTSISTKMNGCTARTSSSIFQASFSTSSYSVKSFEFLVMMTWALTPSTFSRNCC